MADLSTDAAKCPWYRADPTANEALCALGGDAEECGGDLSDCPVKWRAVMSFDDTDELDDLA